VKNMVLSPQSLDLASRAIVKIAKRSYRFLEGEIIIMFKSDCNYRFDFSVYRRNSAVRRNNDCVCRCLSYFLGGMKLVNCSILR